MFRVSGKSKTFFYVLLTASVVFACFWPALDNGFVWDDRHNLVENEQYRGLSGSHLRWMFTTFHDANYHPLAWMSLGLDYVFWGMNPAGYHFTNLVLHALNAVLFYFLTLAFLQGTNVAAHATGAVSTRTSALAAALFFAVHPLRVETVAWVSTRADLLCGFFYLLTIMAYVQFIEKASFVDRGKWLLASLFFFAASLLSRAWGVTLPLVLLILDVYPYGRLERRGRPAASLQRVSVEKIPFVFLAAAAAVPALMAKKSSMLTVAEHGLAGRVTQAAYGLCIYPLKTLWPVRISTFDLLGKNFNPWAPAFVVGVFLAAGITAGLILTRRRRPFLLTAWACYAVTVSPLLGLVQSGPQLVADRYTYISCMPFAVLLGAGLGRLSRQARSNAKQSRTAGAAAAGAVWVCLLVLAVLSFRQTRVWQDDLTYWSYALETDSNNYLAYNNRGVYLKDRKGDWAGALADFNRAAELNPEFADAFYNRALIFERQGNYAGAVEDYTRVVRLKPGSEKAYNNRGGVFRKMGKLEAAGADFDTAIRLAPSSPEGYANRAVLRRAQNDIDGSIQDLEKALEVASDRWAYREQVEKILAETRPKLK